jgi:hypothetical protein
VLAALAAACAVVAVAIPRGPWADEIFVVDQLDVSTSIEVQIDDRRVVLHPPQGYAIRGWGQSNDSSVDVTMIGEGAPVYVHIAPGRPSGGRRGVVVREIVDGASMSVFSRLPDEVVQRMFDELEIT